MDQAALMSRQVQRYSSKHLADLPLIFFTGTQHTGLSDDYPQLWRHRCNEVRLPVRAPDGWPTKKRKRKRRAARPRGRGCGIFLWSSSDCDRLVTRRPTSRDEDRDRGYVRHPSSRALIRTRRRASSRRRRSPPRVEKRNEERGETREGEGAIR